MEGGRPVAKVRHAEGDAQHDAGNLLDVQALPWQLRVARAQQPQLSESTNVVRRPTRASAATSASLSASSCSEDDAPAPSSEDDMLHACNMSRVFV
jgi:hypothetical protein